MYFDNRVQTIQRMAKIAVPALLAMAALPSAPAQTPFVISSANSSLVLDVPESSKAPGVDVQQWTPNGGANQQWTLRRYGSSLLYEIVSVNSGLVLDVAGDSEEAGARIDQYTAQGAPNQLWSIYRRAGSTEGYEIVSSQMERVKTCSGDCLPDEVNLVLDVPASSQNAGTLIQQYTENDGINQQWNFNAESQARITLSFTESGGAIQIAGYHFKANSRVCPVLEDPLGGIAPCANVASDGTFRYSLGPEQSGTELMTGPGHIVVVIDDADGNVLAIGSVSGYVNENLK